MLGNITTLVIVIVLLCGIIKIMNITGKIETSQQICRNQANTSSAKQQWSFSKAPRFAAYRGYTNTISYQIPDSKSKRKAGIGIGNRSKHFDGVNTSNPSPFKYQAKSDFERKQQRRGYSFTSNRDELKYANYLQQAQDTPSAYGINEKQTKKTRSYSMRPKTAYPQNYFLPNGPDTSRLNEWPGPGKYQTIDMLGSGKNFANSKHTNQMQRSFAGGDRFNSEKSTPGPLDYPVSSTIEPDGIYVLSTMKSNGRRQILNQKRELTLKGNRETPGPGTYERPSDFGHYDDPSASRMQRPKTARN